MSLIMNKNHFSSFSLDKSQLPFYVIWSSHKWGHELTVFGYGSGFHFSSWKFCNFVKYSKTNKIMTYTAHFCLLLVASSSFQQLLATCLLLVLPCGLEFYLLGISLIKRKSLCTLYLNPVFSSGSSFHITQTSVNSSSISSSLWEKSIIQK
jgi:hypothetical protein